MTAEQRRASGSDTLIGKVTSILDVFLLGPSYMTLSELAEATGLAKSTVYRISEDLVRSNLLEKDGWFYHLGGRLYEYGARAPRIEGLNRDSSLALHDLAARTGLTVGVGVLAGAEVVYIASLPGNKQSLPFRAGYRSPAYTTATGKALLAFASDDTIEEAIADLTPLTGRTIVSPSALRHDLEKTRERGYSIDREETAPGIVAIGAPIFDRSRRVVGAISAAGSQLDVTVSRVSREVQAVSCRISPATV